MTGGVSAEIFDVEDDTQRVIVKQARRLLKVAGRWEADPARIVTEARALRLAGTIVDAGVPAVLDLDELRHVMILAPAPASFANWKVQLLAGDINADVARRLGAMLAAWHSATYQRGDHHVDLREDFGSIEGFVELRIEPFYRTTASRHPELATTLNELADALLARHDCLVHGDFSPKNILTDGVGVWVLDWEVAHLGDPCFDLGFLLAHLMAKSVHRPIDAAAYRECASQFLATYSTTACTELGAIDHKYLGRQAAALLLARVDGLSPADYLNDDARLVARHVATTALGSPLPTALDLWELL
jgi:5-methylthioribose kinase